MHQGQLKHRLNELEAAVKKQGSKPDIKAELLRKHPQVSKWLHGIGPMVCGHRVELLRKELRDSDRSHNLAVWEIVTQCARARLEKMGYCFTGDDLEQGEKWLAKTLKIEPVAGTWCNPDKWLVSFVTPDCNRLHCSQWSPLLDNATEEIRKRQSWDDYCKKHFRGNGTHKDSVYVKLSKKADRQARELERRQEAQQAELTPALGLHHSAAKYE